MKKTNTDLVLNGNNQPEVADVFTSMVKITANTILCHMNKGRLLVCRTAELRAMRPVWLRADSL